AVATQGIHILVDIHLHQRQHRFRVQRDVADPSDGHAGDGYPSPHRQSTQILELRIKLVSRLGWCQRQAAYLKGQHHQCQNPGNEKYTDRDFHGSHTHQKSPNMTAVRMKSSPSTARDEMTTVFVVALLIPSDVGIRSYP